MKKILLILTLALLIPFLGFSQKYVGIESLRAESNETEEFDGDRNVWVTWAKNPAYYVHRFPSLENYGPFSRFTPADLTEYVGATIERIRIRVGNTDTEPTIFFENPHVRVYVGGSVIGTGEDAEFEPGDLVFDYQLPTWVKGNNIVELPNPILITGTKEIWFGAVFHVVQGYPMCNINYEINPNPSYQPDKSNVVFSGDHNEFFIPVSSEGYSWIQAMWVTKSACEGPTNLKVDYNDNCVPTLSWTAPVDNPSAVYTVKRDAKILSSNVTSTTYTDNSSDFNPATAYTWSVTAKCTSGEDSPDVKLVKSCVNCPTPNNLTLKSVDNCEAILITWTAAADALNFDIYRNGALIKKGLTEKSYRDDDYIHDQANTYYVVSNCAMGWVESAPQTITCQGINENKFNFSIKPNPAHNELTISATTTFNSVNIVNFLGQTVISQNNDTPTTTIDVSNLTQGVYFVRIVSDEGTSVQKFVKK